jgi:Ran GTPase-activating protein (RanGAP) involved in mRNA processing and transport
VNLDGYALPVKKLKGTDPVETLDLSGKDLGVASVVVIASLISVNGGLTKISLAQNKLEEEGTKAICEALEQNKTLKELDISGNVYGSNIGGSAGVKHVAKMLGVNGALTQVFAFCPPKEMPFLLL